MEPLSSVGIAIAVGLGAMLILWLVSLRLRNAGIVDAWWGPGIVLITGVTALASGAGPRIYVWGLVALWGARLAIHIGLRAWRADEDRRYAAWRKQHGDRWPVRSLFQVFLLQGLLAPLFSLPALWVLAKPGGPSLGWLDAVAVAVFGVGLAVESVADWQLRRFIRAGDRSAVMDRGLWRYSRHPNYFGEALLWWGIGLAGVAHGAPWTLVGPALLTFSLLRVSGVSLLEKDMAERRPGYAEYVRRTSAFIPWPPKE